MAPGSRFRKQKLELKYDTFLRRAKLEEELRFGPFFKLKAQADSDTVRHLSPCRIVLLRLTIKWAPQT